MAPVASLQQQGQHGEIPPPPCVGDGRACQRYCTKQGTVQVRRLETSISWVDICLVNYEGEGIATL